VSPDHLCSLLAGVTTRAGVPYFWCGSDRPVVVWNTGRGSAPRWKTRWLSGDYDSAI